MKKTETKTPISTDQAVTFLKLPRVGSNHPDLIARANLRGSFLVSIAKRGALRAVFRLPVKILLRIVPFMRASGERANQPPIRLLKALRPCRGVFLGLVVFSALINVLYLTGSFYMLQIYDRVIPSRSIPTLVALSILAGAFTLAQAALDFVRSRILLRISRSFDEGLESARLCAHEYTAADERKQSRSPAPT